MSVLGLCLNLAIEHFHAAAKRLDERDAGALTVAEQAAGESLLEQFLASLTPSQSPTPPTGPMGEPPPGAGDEKQPPSSPLLAAEVRLLLRMQEELLARTRVLLDLKTNGQDLTKSQLAELRLLRDRQQRLVETARTMMGKNSTHEPTNEQPEGQP